VIGPIIGQLVRHFPWWGLEKKALAWITPVGAFHLEEVNMREGIEEK
jgi:hypothetical protein